MIFNSFGPQLLNNPQFLRRLNFQHRDEVTTIHLNASGSSEFKQLDRRASMSLPRVNGVEPVIEALGYKLATQCYSAELPQ